MRLPRSSVIRSVIPRATLDLVGGGYLEREIRVQHHSGVTVHGFVQESVKVSLLSRADLLLLPGTREGWGIVAMEAASYGVPAVAYDIPGLREVVMDGVTGVLVPISPKDLAAASIELLQDPDRWIRNSRAGQHRSGDFTWDRTAQDLLRTMTLPGSPSSQPESSSRRLPPPTQTVPSSLLGAHLEADPKAHGHD